MLILALLTVSVPGFTCRTASAEKKDGWEIKSSTELGFDSVYEYSYSKNSIVGKVNGKVAIFNTQTGEWIKTEYDGMVEFYSDLCVSKKTKNGAEYYIIDSETGEVLHKLGEFDRVYPDWIVGGFVWFEAYKNSKEGLIDIDGNVLIPIVHSAMDYLYVSSKDGEQFAYFECSKEEGKAALYTSKKKQITDYNYKWIYYKPITSKENQIGNCTIRGSEVISAENLAGEIGLLIDGKEIGFDKKLNDAKEGTVAIFHKIKCGMEDYAIKCFYDSKEIYENAEHLWVESFSGYDNAYYRSEKDLFEVLSLQQSGVAYDIYDMDGETVSLDSLLQELKKAADAEEEAEAAAEEELQNKVKAEIDKLDMDSLCTGTDYVEVSEIETKEIEHEYGKISVELEAKFSKSPDEDSHVDYDRNTVVAIYDENYELIAYGICLYGWPTISFCYRDVDGKLHYFYNGYGVEYRDNVFWEDTKGEYCRTIVYYNDIDYHGDGEKDVVGIYSNNYEKCLISDEEGKFVQQECMRIGRSINLDNRVLITASKDTALVYDSEWKLIKRIDLSELNGKFEAEYYDDGIWIYADDVSKKDIKITSAGEVSKFAKSSLAEMVDITVRKSWVRNDKCYSLLSGRNGGKYEYVMYCRETDEILFTVADNMYIETDETDCVVDDEVLLANDKSSISFGDDLYWVYEEQGYYGLIDESGNVVIDGKKEGFNSQSYSSSYYGGLSSITFKKDDERITAAEILKTSEEGERLKPEKYGDIMYAYTGDYDTGYDEYVFDKEGNIIYKNLGIASRDWSYYYGNTWICENIKLILKVDSEGTEKVENTTCI